jgi:hypothetical protein
MPTFRIELDNGDQYDVDAPDEATAQSDLMASLNPAPTATAQPAPEKPSEAQRLSAERANWGSLTDEQKAANRKATRSAFYSKQARQNIDPNAGALKKFGYGMMGALGETGEGVAALVSGREGAPPGSEEMIAELKAVKGPAAFSGAVAADVGTMMIPGGAAAKAPMFKGVADAAVNIGMEGLKAPTEQQSRTDRMINAAVGTGMFKAAEKYGAPIVKGIKQSDSAKFLQDLAEEVGTKIDMTVGQASTGMFRTLENTLANSAVTWNDVKGLQDAAMTAWNDIMRRTVGKQLGVTDLPHGREAYAALDKAFTQQYAELWERKFPLDLDKLSTSMMQIIKSGRRGRAAPSNVSEISKVGGEVLTLLQSGAREKGLYDGRAIDAADDVIRRAIDAAYSKGGGGKTMAELLDQMRTRLRATLPPESQIKHQQLDKAWSQFSTLKAAAGKGSKGVMTPKALENEISKRGLNQYLSGDAPMLKATEAARDVFEATAAGSKPPQAEKFWNAVISLPAKVTTNPTVQKILMGESSIQVKAANLAAMLGEAGFTSSRLGAAAGAQGDIIKDP